MASYYPEARTRQQLPICNAIEAGDLRQALKMIEKRLAKTNDSYLQVLQCFVQSDHPLVTERGHAYLRLAALADPNCKEFITDIEELGLYDEAASRLSVGQDGTEMSNIICRIRLAAVKAAPKNEKLGIDCFRACLLRTNWNYAQQIATVLEKNFPGNHEYAFWKLTTMLLFTETPGCDDMKKNILRTVASRTLQSFAKATATAADESPLPVKSLHQPQEILLYHRVLDLTNQTPERVNVYNDPHCGSLSKIAKGAWIFKRDHVILLEASEKWQELFDLCHDLLEGAQATTTGKIVDARGADWTVWKAYINAAAALQSAETHDKVRDQVQSHLAPTSGINKTYRRNASLANILFAFNLQKDGKILVWGSIDVKIKTSHDLAAVIAHLAYYGHTAAGFDDVKEYLERLSPEQHLSLLQINTRLLHLRSPYVWSTTEDEIISRIQPRKVSDTEDLTSQVTGVKLQSFLQDLILATGIDEKKIDEGKKADSESIDSSDEYTKCILCQNSRYKWCETCFKGSAQLLIRDYGCAIMGGAIGGPWVQGNPVTMGVKLNILPTDNHPLDDMALMAAMYLIKLTAPAAQHFANITDFTKRNGPKRLIQAAAFLEFAHSKSPTNSRILLVLVRLYALLGAGSLAMKAYSKLNVKQIQGDTLGYVLFDRISSLHPHPVQDDDSGPAGLLDPTTQIEKLQHTYRSFHRQINSNCWKSFESGSYNSIFQLLEASDKLSRSVGRALSVIELRKIRRLTNPLTIFNVDSHGYDLLPSDPICREFSDNLDYNSFPSFEATGTPSVERLLRLGPPPSDFRTRGSLLIDELWMVLRSPAETRTAISATLFHLEKSFAAIINVKPTDLMTGHETALYTIGINLVHFIINACIVNKESDMRQCKGPKKCIFDIALTLSNLKNGQLLDVDAAGYFPDFKKTLHALYVTHEAATLVIAASKFLNAKAVETNAETRHEMAAMADLAREVYKVVANKAEEVRTKMNADGWMDNILTWLHEEPVGDPKADIAEWWHPEYVHTMGRCVTRELGDEFCETWAGELIASWRESVMGLAALHAEEVTK